jgi:hypothetical protein
VLCHVKTWVTNHALYCVTGGKIFPRGLAGDWEAEVNEVVREDGTVDTFSKQSECANRSCMARRKDKEQIVNLGGDSGWLT